MVLLPKAEAFFLQLIHHAVEYLYDAVGFLLAYRCQTAAEILCPKQVHPPSNGVQWFDDFPVEINQVDQTQSDEAFYQIESPSVFFRGYEQ